MNLFSMPNHSIYDLLKQSFPKSHKEDWSSAASRETQGKNPFEILAWKTKEGINFFPYYERQDCKDFGYLKNFELPPSANLHHGARSWKSLPKISVTDIETANAVALSHLATGADGLLFDLSKFNVVDVNVLLDKIDWPYCDVSFLVTPSTKVIQDLIPYILKKKYNPGSLTGTLFWRNTPEDVIINIKALSSLNKFHSLGIYVNTSSPVQEISDALTKAVTLMDELTDKGVEKDLVWQNIHLSLAAGTDFFLEIAKLKALRLLWYQLAGAFEIKTYKHTDLQIHVRSEPWIKEEFQPHSNMLKSTSAALAAVIGGCDSLTIVAEDENNIMMNRIARNLSNILREEAHIDKVSDPTAGAYSVETSVHKIAQAAWIDFQHKMKPS